MTTRIILLLVILLNANISFAGTNFTDITSTITIHDLSSGWSSSSAISKQEQERRFELIKKIEAIQKQFEEEDLEWNFASNTDNKVTFGCRIIRIPDEDVSRILMLQTTKRYYSNES